MWKVVVQDFNVLWDWLVWVIDNERHIRISHDPWAGFMEHYRLPEWMANSFLDIDYIFLYQIVDYQSSSPLNMAWMFM